MQLKPSDSFHKQTWRLLYPYWQSEDRIWAWGLLLGILGNIGIFVYLTFQINYWNKEFFDTFSTLDYGEFKRLLWVFGMLATAAIIAFTFKSYLMQVLNIRWRQWLTQQYTQMWLSHHAYYGLQLDGEGTDNPDQRIQQDINSFTAVSTSFFFTAFTQFVLMVTFLGVLWSISGEYTFHIWGVDFVIQGYMCWAALILAIAATYISIRIGRPLIRLDYEQEKREADFRYSLVRLRENVEGVALYQGEEREDSIFLNRFKKVVTNYYHILHCMITLNAWTSGYAQAGGIIPAILASPKIFAGIITFGGFMQIANAYRYVESALSFVVTNYAAIASWKATTLRLIAFSEQAAVIREKQIKGESKIKIKEQADQTKLELRNLHVELPNGEILFDKFHSTFKKGEHTLIIGPSGTGKSTLFRTLAGIWPYGAGEILVPKDTVLMFLPQKPYMPLGTLGEVLCYPNAQTDVDPKLLEEVLEKTKLETLTRRLSEVNDWARVLSLGEQQRVAVARALIQQPDWLFLDEATSAMEEKAESQLYQVLRKSLPQTTLISIGHRASLKKQHDHVITLKRKPHVESPPESEILVLE